MPLSELGCSTPVPRSLAQEVGLVCAAVYGVVWRKCQMEEGICRASLDTLGLDIGVDRATVLRNIKRLCELGYLIDLTPGRRNAPHTYQLGKSVAECNSTKDKTVVMRNSLDPETVAESNTTVAHNNTSIESVAQSNSSNQTVAESYLKKEESLNPVESNRESRESHAPVLNDIEQLGKSLNDICGYDPDAPLTNGTKTRLNDALNFLTRKRATPKLVHRFKDEYWWGTSPPKPNQVTEEWNRFIESLQAKEPQKKRMVIT